MSSLVRSECLIVFGDVCLHCQSPSRCLVQQIITQIREIVSKHIRIGIILLQKVSIRWLLMLCWRVKDAIIRPPSHDVTRLKIAYWSKNEKELGELNIYRQVSALFEFSDMHIQRLLFAVIRPNMGDFFKEGRASVKFICLQIGVTFLNNLVFKYFPANF